MSDDAATTARRIIDDGKYMTLATADESGQPWASPVYYAPSSFDSGAAPGEGQADHVAPGRAVRLYRAAAVRHWILDKLSTEPGNHRLAVRP